MLRDSNLFIQNLIVVTFLWESKQDVHRGLANTNKEVFFVRKLKACNVTENAKIVGEFWDDGVQCQMSNTEEMNCRITRGKAGCHWNIGEISLQYSMWN